MEKSSIINLVIMKNILIKIAAKIIFGMMGAGIWFINRWYDFPEWIKHIKNKSLKRYNKIY